MSQSIKGIQSIMYGYGKKINAPEYLLVVLSAPADDGAPYVEVKGEYYSYISSERGYEIFRKVTNSLDELLYWIMSRAASQMSVEYELDNRVGGNDTRRVQFSNFLNLIRIINEEWAVRAVQEIEEILRCSPFVDG